MQRHGSQVRRLRRYKQTNRQTDKRTTVTRWSRHDLGLIMFLQSAVVSKFILSLLSVGAFVFLGLHFTKDMAIGKQFCNVYQIKLAKIVVWGGEYFSV